MPVWNRPSEYNGQTCILANLHLIAGVNVTAFEKILFTDVKPTDLRGILHYIPRFREKTFILSMDGAIVTNENFPNLLLDVAVLRSLNIRVVIVHGASAQIQALAP